MSRHYTIDFERAHRYSETRSIDQTSVAHTHTEDTNGKTHVNIIILDLGNVDCTGRLKVGTRFILFYFFNVLPLLRTESLAEALIN